MVRRDRFRVTLLTNCLGKGEQARNDQSYQHVKHMPPAPRPVTGDDNDTAAEACHSPQILVLSGRSGR